MISKKNIGNLFLITILLSVIMFYGYYIIQYKGSITVKKSQTTNQLSNVTNLEKGVTKFFDVEYKTISNNNKNYFTRGKEAFISLDNPNLVELKIVHSFTTLKDGTSLNIRSKKGEYQKKNKNIMYSEDVIITNKKSIITAEKANFYANKNLIKLEKLTYKDEKNLIKGDFAELDTITNNLEIFMKNKNDKVYGQRK